MIYITGDTHGGFTRFSSRYTKAWTSDDHVIICGDFGGVWSGGSNDAYWLDWLASKPWTTLFVDGNHENYDLLNEYPVVDYCGGKAHKIRDNVYHLMRGYVFTIEGKTFFAFGGASSHDIDDGILDRNDFETGEEFSDTIRQWNKLDKWFRVNHISWWEEELPNQEEMDRGIKNLEEHGWQVDYVITHCLPQEIASLVSYGSYKPDIETIYFNSLLERGLKFKSWYCGHYHKNYYVYNYNILYEAIKCLEEYEDE